MKFAPIKRISRDELSKAGELPKWIDLFLNPLNSFIEQVGQAVQGQLDFENNFRCKVARVALTHATLTEVSPFTNARQKTLKVQGVIFTDAGGQSVDKFKWARKENGNIDVQAHFDGGTADTKSNCTLIILLG